MSRIKREIRRNPLGTSKEVFENADVPDVPKSTRSHILRNVAKCGKPEVRPPIKDVHKKKRMECAKNHMKVNFQQFFSPTSVERPLMDPMDGGEDGFARRVHVPTGSGVSKVVVV